MAFSGYMRPVLRKALRMRLSEENQRLRVRALSLHATTCLSCNMAFFTAPTPLKPCGRSDIVVNVIAFQYSGFLHDTFLFFHFCSWVFLRHLVCLQLACDAYAASRTRKPSIIAHTVAVKTVVSHLERQQSG